MVTEATYVAEFLRQMRNTHHGYDLTFDAMEKLFAQHTGWYGDEPADLALLLWIACVHNPLFVANGTWVDGLRLRRTAMLMPS